MFFQGEDEAVRGGVRCQLVAPLPCLLSIRVGSFNEPLQ